MNSLGLEFSCQSDISILHSSQVLIRVTRSSPALKDISFRAVADLRRGLRMFSPARLTAASQRGSPDVASSSCQRKHSAGGWGWGLALRCQTRPSPTVSRGWTYPRDPTGPRLSGDQRHFVAPGFQQLG